MARYTWNRLQHWDKWPAVPLWIVRTIILPFLVSLLGDYLARLIK